MVIAFSKHGKKSDIQEINTLKAHGDMFSLGLLHIICCSNDFHCFYMYLMYGSVLCSYTWIFTSCPG